MTKFESSVRSGMFIETVVKKGSKLRRSGMSVGLDPTFAHAAPAELGFSDGRRFL